MSDWREIEVTTTFKTGEERRDDLVGEWPDRTRIIRSIVGESGRAIRYGDHIGISLSNACALYRIVRIDPDFDVFECELVESRERGDALPAAPVTDGGTTK